MRSWFTTLASFDAVTDGYLEAVGVRIVRGRAFGPQDRTGSDPVAIVAESTAHSWWPEGDPIGRRLRIGTESMTVVGVAQDALGIGALDRMAYAPNQAGRTRRMRVRVYRPMAQADIYPEGWSDYVDAGHEGLVIIARGREHPQDAAAAVSEALAALAPDVPVVSVGGLLDRQVGLGARQMLAKRRLVSVAAGAGVFLVLLGIFGVAAEGVERRTREIGVRLALGSPRPSLLAAMARESVLTSLAGIGIGLAVVAPLHASIDRLLVPYMRLGYSLGNPWLIAAAIGGILTVGLLATFAGARRALSVPPAEALRGE
jgi:hypothetical protein